MTETPMGFAGRFWLAYLVFFKLLFDGSYARRVDDLHRGRQLPAPKSHDAEALSAVKQELLASSERVEALEAQLAEQKAQLAALEPSAPVTPEFKAEDLERAEQTGALWMLSVLQREGRLVDFLKQDIAGFDDAEIGGAARVIHEGCQRGLKQYIQVEPVHAADEGSCVEIPRGYDAKAVKLTGNVQGSGPYMGVLRHKGWRAEEVTLPKFLADQEPRVLAQAEVEL